MNKIYHLSTCDTCKRIIKQLGLPDNFTFQDIKSEPITVKQLEEMKKLSGSYESLFSRRAKLYKERNLAEEDLAEEDYKGFILEHYTFLKRPVIITGGKIFIGNSKKTVEAAAAAIAGS
ncbi:arsenate reductase [Sinomicrobium oceani]|uniref:Arsenate reductase n=1 Tax=Sinomicrobium oceani TaxID=1150368 RepID=A0A1K1P3R3_9FLAO|nr:ArsC/Spx/MgsR family protein [Sinomicrobium oceani]SFW42107.1 arsenate reductase [Sinomicrobium oceani]